MPDPQNKDWFSQFEEDKSKDYFSQFEEVPKTPEKEPEKGFIDKAFDFGKAALAKGQEEVQAHPTLRRFLFGPSKEDLGGRELTAEGTSPGEIPGLRNAAGYLRNKMINTGDYVTGFAGGLIGEFGPGFIEGMADPGQAGIKTIPPVEPKFLGAGTYHATPTEVGVHTPTDIVSPESMRDSLRIKQRPTDIELKPSAVEEAPKIKNAQEFISQKKEGNVPEGMSFSDWQNLELPQMAKTEGGVKIGADVKSLGRVLGSSLYKGEISKIVTKELLQNAVDATRHLGDQANIKVRFIEGKYNVESPKVIEVSDNGKGMTRDELETVFTDLGSSGKRNDPNSVGGFGLAKAAPLLGGERVEVISVVNEGGRIVKHTFSGTPEELLDGVNIKTTPAGKGETTGTTVRTQIPSKSYLYQAEDFVRNLAENSPELQGKIEFNRQTGDYKSSPTIFTPKKDSGTVINLSNPSADVDIIIPKDAKYGESVGVPIKVLNNGMYQNKMQYGGYNTIPSVPNNVLVNVKSKVPEGHPDYPFTANREELRGTTHEAINKYIQDNIINPGINARTNAIKKAYNSIPNVNGISFYDVGQKFTPNEFNAITNHPIVVELGTAIQDSINELMGLIGREEWTNKLEKTGLIFDEKVRGIHIPNPGEKKSAVLINPFAIMENNTPGNAAAGINHVIQHEVAHIHGGGHDEGFTTRLADIVEKHGEADTERRNQFKQILTGGGRDYLPEVQDILSKYTEARGRESTYDDPLYGTGIGARNRQSKRAGEIPNDPRPPAARAIGKLLDAMMESKISRAQQDVINSVERGRRAAAFEGVKEKGKLGFQKSMAQLGGEIPKINAPELKLNARDVDDLYNAIKFNKRITTFEKARTGIALKKLLDGSSTLQRNELNLMDRVFGPGTADQIMELHGGLGIVGKIQLAKASNTMKSMMASIDLSAPFRQGLGLVGRKEFWNSFASMFNYARSHDAFMALQRGIEEHPNYLLSRNSGLFIADHEMSSYEEQFMNSYINDVRNIGKAGRVITEPFAASERAYVGFLNKLRFDTFNSLLQKANKAGLQTYTMQAGEKYPTELTRSIAKYVNVSTGRGDLGRLSKYSDDLNTVLFSPRLIASRLTILNPKYYIDAPAFVREEALKTLLAMGTFTGTVGAIGSVMGGETKLTPNSKNLTNPDFGKLKFGKTRLDPGGGLNQYIVAANQFVQGKATSSTSGRTYPLGGGFGQTSRLGKIAGIGGSQPSFLENKFSPIASLVDTLLTGRSDASGQPINVPVEIRKRFTPLIIQDIMDLYKEDPDLIGLGVPAAFGMGLQTYQEREPSMGMSAPKMNLNLRP